MYMMCSLLIIYRRNKKTTAALTSGGGGYKNIMKNTGKRRKIKKICIFLPKCFRIWKLFCIFAADFDKNDICGGTKTKV